MRVRSLSCVLTTLVFATMAFAATRQVGPGQPYTTIQSCLNAAAAGDVCNVHAGTYNENLTLQSNGTSSSRVRLQANAGDTVTVQSSSSPVLNVGSRSYWTVDGIRFTYNGSSTGAYVVSGSGSYNTFSNNRFTLANGGGTVMKYMQSSHLTVSNNVFAVTTTASGSYCGNFLYNSDLLVAGNECYGVAAYPSGKLVDGFAASGPNLTFNNNYVHDGWSYDSHPDGIVIQGDGGNTTNVQVIGNTIRNFGSAGIYFDAIWGPEQGVIANNVIEETSSFRYGTSANKMNCIDVHGECVGSGCSSYTMKVKVFNNTLACRQLHMKFTSLGTGSDVQFKNNILVDPPYTAVYGGTTSNGASVDYNFYSGGDSSPIQWNGAGRTVATMRSSGWGEANGLSGKALLNADYTEQSNSPTINVGQDFSSYFTIDKAGNLRPSSGPWDVGAYEYSGSAVGPTPPSGLTALVQ